MWKLDLRQGCRNILQVEVATMVIQRLAGHGQVIGMEVGHLASCCELNTLLILSRQTTIRIIHVIEHAKLEGLHHALV